MIAFRKLLGAFLLLVFFLILLILIILLPLFTFFTLQHPFAHFLLVLAVPLQSSWLAHFWFQNFSLLEFIHNLNHFRPQVQPSVKEKIF